MCENVKFDTEPKSADVGDLSCPQCARVTAENTSVHAVKLFIAVVNYSGSSSAHG